MSTIFSPFHQRDGDACRWITSREYRDLEDHIRERGFPIESELHAVYIDIRDALDYGNINFAVVGGYAMNAYGITRQTRDVDFYFNAADEDIFGVLRALPFIAIRDGLGSSSDNFRVHFMLSTGVVVGVDFHRVRELWVHPFDLKLESNKNVVILDKETRTLTSTGLINSKLRGLHCRRKAELPTVQDEEDIYRLIVSLIRVEDACHLNRNILVKELLQASSLSLDHRQAIQDIINPQDIE